MTSITFHFFTLKCQILWLLCRIMPLSYFMTPVLYYASVIFHDSCVILCQCHIFMTPVSYYASVIFNNSCVVFQSVVFHDSCVILHQCHMLWPTFSIHYTFINIILFLIVFPAFVTFKYYNGEQFKAVQQYHQQMELICHKWKQKWDFNK